MSSLTPGGNFDFTATLPATGVPVHTWLVQGPTGLTVATDLIPNGWAIYNITPNTTTGNIDARVRVPLGTGAGYYDLIVRATFPGSGGFGPSDKVLFTQESIGGTPTPTYGCTDSAALNYDIEATSDDGSCTYPPPPPVYGCTDPTALNYNPLATNDDGSCVYPVPGCTDPDANNYDPSATVDDGSCNYDGRLPASIASTQIVLDDYQRPAAVLPVGGLKLLTSKDAGHRYDRYLAKAGTFYDPNLLFDRYTNRPRIVYVSGTGLFATTAASNGEPAGDFGAQLPLATITGGYPICAQHPQDHSRVLMAYLDSGVLKTSLSPDNGDPDTWETFGTIDSGPLNFTATGRAGLCWVSDRALVVYASGSNLLARTSTDGGKTWGLPVMFATSGPYTAASAVALEGEAFAAAIDAAGVQHAWASGTLGVDWEARTAPPKVTGNGLGVHPGSGRLYWGTTHRSDDSSQTWTAA